MLGDLGNKRRGAMTMTMRALLLFPALLASACSIFAEPTTAGIAPDGQLYYRGSLDAAANEILMASYDKAAEKPQVLRITSGGGNVYLGMDIGEWVHAKGLDVHVVKGCASSCANYVFTAGHRKLLDRDSVLFWHGGAYQRGLWEEYGDGLSSWRMREDAFFERIGVDGRITVCGQPAQLYLNKSRDEPYVGFDYSPEGMRRFGMRNIVLVDGEWNWRAHHPGNEVLRVNVIGRQHDLRCEAEQ